MKAKHWYQVLVLFVVCLVSPLSRADLYTANQALAKKDYERAFQLYRDLAELGQPYAQQMVAAFYVEGLGVKRDNVLGYAWASIARDNGVNNENTQNIISQLEPHLNDKARIRIDEVRAQFATPALRKRILPNIFAGVNYIDREPCKLSKGPTKATYPNWALRDGIQGEAYVEFTVMPDGRARNPRVVYAVPGDVFDEAARETILVSEFSPARIKGVPVDCTIGTMVRFVIQNAENDAYTELEHYVKGLKTKADAGDPSAQLIYGLAISGLPQLKKTRSDGMPWILKAAQSGLPTAQFMVGYSTLQGWGCECDEPKGLVWLHKAAASDQSDAQVVLANYLLRGDPGPEEIGKAQTWLERAAASGNHDGKFYLAGLLAAGADPGKRDPERALKVLKEVMHDVDVDPTAFEIRAAANAMLGKFPEAQKDQNKALKMAQKLGWETASQQARLASYVASKPWTGDLFAF
ncbi:MAG: TonB family protein [Pseudomonadota bacterium]